MLEMPHNPVSQAQSQSIEYRIERNVQRGYATSIHVVSYLPTEATLFVQNTRTLFDYSALLLHVAF